MEMKCVDCKWWEIVEKDEDERKELHKEVAGFDISEENDAKKIQCWIDAKQLLDAGWCKRFPPVLKRNEGVDFEGGDDYYTWFAGFPKTCTDEHCGEFCSK